MELAVNTQGLVKKYGTRHALNGLTLQVPRYSIMGLVGPNGAGKTTWMMSVAGFLKISAGTIDLLGDGPFNAAHHRGRLTILPQDSELPLESRPLELLIHYGRLQGLTRREAQRSASETLASLNLADRSHTAIRTLSHGMRKRVMIAQCFIGHPELVLLDEPLSGLDPREAANTRNFIAQRRLRQTIVISSHNLHELELICDHIAFFELGRALKVAPISDITSASNTLIYTLAAPLTDTTPLQNALADATFTLDDSATRLTCASPNLQPAAINRTLLPLLLHGGHDILTITRGSTLESAYLNHTPPGESRRD